MLHRPCQIRILQVCAAVGLSGVPLSATDYRVHLYGPTCSMQPLTTADHAVSTVTVNAFARFRVVRCAAHRRGKAGATLASYNIHHTL